MQELERIICSFQEHIAQYVKDAQQIRQHLEELDGYWYVECLIVITIMEWLK